MTPNKKSFASDNYAGVHPAVLQAINNCANDHAPAYGYDCTTQAAEKLIQQHFGAQAQTFFVFNGTGANVLALDLMTESYQSVLCAETAHINVDECAAPEKIVRCKLIPIASSDGKLTPELVKPYLKGFGFEHSAQPRVISISQVSEYGTVYQAAEIRALADLAHAHGMVLHLDGARLSNAVASLGVSLREITRDAGVDILTFGGTKNGMIFGEAVIFFDESLVQKAKFLRKQNLQLASKMRFLSAQFIALLNNDYWLKNAQQANKMAKLLEAELMQISGIHITQKVEANSVFVVMPLDVHAAMQEHYAFYVWSEEKSEVRLMASFDTTQAEVKDFSQKLRDKMKGK